MRIGLAGASVVLIASAGCERSNPCFAPLPPGLLGETSQVELAPSGCRIVFARWQDNAGTYSLQGVSTSPLSLDGERALTAHGGGIEPRFGADGTLLYLDDAAGKRALVARAREGDGPAVVLAEDVV